MSSFKKRSYLYNKKFETKKKYHEFSVLTWNILCQDNLKHNDMEFPNRNNYKERYNQITKMIVETESDIVCLQELDKDAKGSYLLSNLEKHGYQHVFFGKTEAERPDGCALVFKTDRVKMVRFAFIPLNLEHLNKFLNKSQVAVAGLFEFKSKKILVLTFHAIYNINRGDVKIWQIIALLKTIKRITETEKIDSVVFAGDFNMTPYSVLYNYITNGVALDFKTDMDPHYTSGYKSMNVPRNPVKECKSTWTEYARHSLSKKSEKEDKKYWNDVALNNLNGIFPIFYEEYILFEKNWKLKVNERCIECFFKMNSAYNDVYSSNFCKTEDEHSDKCFEPSLTHWNDHVYTACDFIFYKNIDRNIHLSKVLEFEVNELSLVMPNQFVPSDHVYLQAVFGFETE